MQGQRYWVRNGRIAMHQAEGDFIGPIDDRAKLNSGSVRITTGDRGTEIKWIVMAPNTTALFATLNWLHQAKAPFILRFFASGWFEEYHEVLECARNRINQIIANGDRHFASHALIREFEISKARASQLLGDCLADETVAEAYGIECEFEENSNQFHVKKVGENSAIGRIYGTFLSSFPCRSSGAYGETVSSAYAEVISTGKPKYDHVLAAMTLPDNEVFWVPYRRLLIPKRENGRNPAVLVVSEIGQVDIQLI